MDDLAAVGRVRAAPPRTLALGWIESHTQGRGKSVGLPEFDRVAADPAGSTMRCLSCVANVSGPKRCFSTRSVDRKKTGRFPCRAVGTLPHPACRGFEALTGLILRRVSRSKGKEGACRSCNQALASRVARRRSYRRAVCPARNPEDIARFHPFDVGRRRVSDAGRGTPALRIWKRSERIAPSYRTPAAMRRWLARFPWRRVRGAEGWLRQPWQRPNQRHGPDGLSMGIARLSARAPPRDC